MASRMAMPASALRHTRPSLPGDQEVRLHEETGATFDRMRRKVMAGEADGVATVELAAETLDERFEALERTERIDQLLSELKARRQVAG